MKCEYNFFYQLSCLSLLFMSLRGVKHFFNMDTARTCDKRGVRCIFCVLFFELDTLWTQPKLTSTTQPMFSIATIGVLVWLWCVEVGDDGDAVARLAASIGWHLNGVMVVLVAGVWCNARRKEMGVGFG